MLTGRSRSGGGIPFGTAARTSGKDIPSRSREIVGGGSSKPDKHQADHVLKVPCPRIEGGPKMDQRMQDTSECKRSALGHLQMNYNFEGLTSKRFPADNLTLKEIDR